MPPLSFHNLGYLFVFAINRIFPFSFLKFSLNFVIFLPDKKQEQQRYRRAPV